MNSKKGIGTIEALLLIAAQAIFLGFCVDMTGETLRRPAYFFGLLSIIMVCYVFRKQLTKDAVIWTMIAGDIVKVSYILYTEVWERQHDVISFGAGEGHAAYIEYLAQFRRLPNFDPRMLWAFFQPPLHHIISAMWMIVNVKLKMPERQLQESMQCITLSYMCILMLIVYLICKELCMKQRGTLITMIIVSFHPIYILLSGSINNDALSICLSALSLYIAIKWYQKPNIISIILLAICIGLAMMAKLSSGLVAPGIGALMLYKLVINRKEWIKYIIQYVVFGLLVFPIGLWWPIRNKIMWDMPINYIPEVGEQLTHSDMLSRLFDVRMHSVYPAMINNKDAYDEYNVILAMIKTSLFGESNFGLLSPYITPFAIVLFITSVIIIIAQIVALIRTLTVKEAAPEVGYKILLSVTALSLLGGYLLFALSYNNFSAQDFRYSALMIAIMSIFLGLWDDRLELMSHTKKISDSKLLWISVIRKCIFITVIVFAVSAACVYLLAGLY